MQTNYPSIDFEFLLKSDIATRKKLIKDYIDQRRMSFSHKQDDVINCSICYADVDQSFFYTNPKCGHSFCLSCISEHAKEKIKQASGPILCPEENCNKEISYNDLISYGIISDPDLLEKYNSTLTRIRLDNDPNTLYCIKCGTPMIGEPGITMVRCVKCNYCFCCKCKEQWHADCTCEQYQRWKKENSMGDDAFKVYIKKNTKLCPQCHKPIEKNGGCNCMTCKCGYQFCWLCMQPYTKTHWKNNKTGCTQYS
ncbi:ariadne RING finger, putative [Entamoeba dispar SAW760]|uniref:RBR-type E3 ubiquitin transferase n=1 Tax=Entamoeba dispar (strain ATCC PRA-260 / SAW760) TaxID=370354 RepID=B0E774_ENTDS|nr:ariadne RING finger, putative [Entamoeba dispar SAW760]EDR29624.1 ariadne RING finger, putative [Entamoeba dispar SAW760]|eukprot:EDR29624.1 ariadne RING finger, putative [Entamoeba dispar SAW760]